MLILKILAVVHLAGWVFFGVQTILTISPEDARKHTAAAFLTAVLCGFLWPILAFTDLTGKERR